MKFISKNRFFLSLMPYLLLFTLVFSKFFALGINFDGTLYATISRNLALQSGNFWTLKIAPLLQENFYEHPPLGFWIQSFFFKWFGDHRSTEKIYMILIGLLLVYLVGKTWDVFTKKSGYRWISQIILILCPAFCTIIKNNWLEGPMLICMLASVICMVKAFESMQIKNISMGFKTSLFTILAGLFLLASVLIKPPVPLALFSFWFIIYFVKYNKTYVSFSLNTMLFGIPFLVFCLYVYLDPNALFFMKEYFKNQVMASIEGKREVASPHFMVFLFFVLDFIVPFIVFAILFLLQRKKYKLFFDREALLFLLCALASSLPLVISSKNMNRYIVPSYPFYAYFFMILFGFYFNELQRRADLASYRKYILGFASLIVIVGLGFSAANFDKVTRPNQKGYFAFFKANQLPKDLVSMSTVPGDSINTDWDFRNNFARDHANLFIRYGANSERYRLYSLPLVAPVPANCSPLFSKNNERYQIFDCAQDLRF